MEVTTERRRALTKGQRTRLRLLEAAVERFGADGFRATSVSQLSRDAGLTPAAAYAYFADKEAFWAAAIEFDLDALDREIRETALASDSPLYQLMAGLVGGLVRHPLTRRVLSEGTSDDLQLVLNHRLFAGTTAVIADRLRVRRAGGHLPEQADPALLATGIETVLFSMIVSVVRAGLDTTGDRIPAVIALLRTAVGGPPTADERAVWAASGSGA